jgi:hypothetical protein
LRDARLRLWSGQLLARFVLRPLLLSLLLLRWLNGIELLGIEHGEYDPGKT